MYKLFLSCLLFVSIILAFPGCGGIREKMEEAGKTATKQFGDQHFKDAIALIELHKIRFGHYPETMDSLKYLGEWNQMIKTSVEYHRVDSGYSLDLVGWVKDPKTMHYPNEFWQGLGLVKSNLKPEIISTP